MRTEIVKNWKNWLEATEKDKVNQYHIISRGNKWAVRKYKSKRATKLFRWREEAYHFARQLSDKVVVHNKDGLVDFISKDY